MGTPKLSMQDFVLKAIEAGATSRSKGIHVVYSGFNAAYKSYFGTDSRAATAKLETAGVIAVRGCRGGVMLYKAGEEPARKDNKAEKLLAGMGVS